VLVYRAAMTVSTRAPRFVTDSPAQAPAVLDPTSTDAVGSPPHERDHRDSTGLAASTTKAYRCPREAPPVRVLAGD
jgi:hypothetical protein